MNIERVMISLENVLDIYEFSIYFFRFKETYLGEGLFAPLELAFVGLHLVVDSLMLLH
jgi:hypothetical protein